MHPCPASWRCLASAGLAPGGAFSPPGGLAPTSPDGEPGDWAPTGAFSPVVGWAATGRFRPPGDWAAGSAFAEVAVFALSCSGVSAFPTCHRNCSRCVDWSRCRLSHLASCYSRGGQKTAHTPNPHPVPECIPRRLARSPNRRPPGRNAFQGRRKIKTHCQSDSFSKRLPTALISEQQAAAKPWTLYTDFRVAGRQLRGRCTRSQSSRSRMLSRSSCSSRSRSSDRRC